MYRHLSSLPWSQLECPLSAHHSWPVSFDRLVTVKGTVIEFKWANPHPMMTLEVQGTDGRTEKWLVGDPAINRMEANGWTKTTVKPGDVITGIGYQFADGQKTSDSSALYCPTAGNCTSTAAKPVHCATRSSRSYNAGVYSDLRFRR